MFASAVLSFGLLFAPSALAAVHDVTVGSSTGTLEFNPEAIVCASLQVYFISVADDHRSSHRPVR